MTDVLAVAALPAALGIGLCGEVAGIAGGSAVFLLPFSEKLTLSGRQAAERFNPQARRGAAELVSFAAGVKKRLRLVRGGTGSAHPDARGETVELSIVRRADASEDFLFRHRQMAIQQDFENLRNATRKADGRIGGDDAPWTAAVSRMAGSSESFRPESSARRSRQP